jgi:pimeloyl-ACP methyl ester carboxylesterase
LSFGSQWSLAVIRRHPDAIARALLTGVEPLDSKVDMPSQVYASLQRIWFEAGQQPDFARYIPAGGLTQVTNEILEQLQREPARVTAKGSNGKDVTLTLGSFDFQRDFVRLAQDPKRLLELRRGQYQSWANDSAARAVSREVDFEFLNALVNASLGSSPERIALLRGDPAGQLLGTLGFDLILETTDSWPAPDVGDQFRKSVETATPVVFVQGDWDTSTPIEDTLALAPYFPNSRVLIVHRGTHNGFMPIAARLPLVFLQLQTFLRTGQMEGLPVEVSMPERKFALPDFPVPPNGGNEHE